MSKGAITGLGEIRYFTDQQSWTKTPVPFWAVKAKPHIITKIKRWFPQAAPHRTGWITLSDTPDVARDLEWMLERWDLTLTDRDRAMLAAGAETHRHRQEAVREILSGERPHLELTDPIREPRDYQLVAADLALTTGRLLLADDLGLGKTMSAVLTLREPAALPALVVCPTHLPSQWEGEIAKTLPWLKTHVVRSLRPYDPAQHRSMRGYDPDVLIMGYAKLRGWGDTLAGKVRTVIFDEAQELRRAESDKYEAAAQIAAGADYRMGLTATPVYNYGGEIHNILTVLAPDSLGSRDEFAREWCNGYWSDKIKVKDPRALGEFLRDEGIMLRRTRRDVGRELPDVIRIPHDIASDEEVFNREISDARSLAEFILNRQGTREQRFTAAGKLDMETRRATGVAKAPYVADFTRMLLESDEQVVLFGWHRDVYDIWFRRLQEFNPVLYTGSESPAGKQRSRDAFLSGEARVMFMSLRSGAGLDGLQDVSKVAVFGELDWSPGMHEQCIGRLHRDGQDDSVLAYFLVSEFGSDPPMAEVLNVKRSQSEPLVNPDVDLLAPQADNSDRVRMLAEQIVNRKQVAA